MVIVYLLSEGKKVPVFQNPNDKPFSSYDHGEFVPNRFPVGDKAVRAYWDAKLQCLRLAIPTEVNLENPSL